MNKQQSGFTLIELIAVIVILSIMAATAVPRFINMQDEAAQAAVNGVAGSLESASALNHAVDVAVEAGLTNTTDDPFYNVANCSEAARVLQGGALPTGYSLNSVVIADKATVTCEVTGPSPASKSAEFQMIGAAGGITPS